MHGNPHVHNGIGGACLGHDASLAGSGWGREDMLRMREAPDMPAPRGFPLGRGRGGGDEAPAQRPGTRQQMLPPKTVWLLAVVFCQAQKVAFPLALAL